VAAVALGLLGFMASGPFLLPFHYVFITAFWSEWLALVLGCAATLLIFPLPRQFVRLPVVVLVPVVLALAILGQASLDRLPSTETGFQYGAYFLFAALMALIGRLLADEYGLQRVADVFATALVAGAAATAMIAILQWNGVTSEWMVPIPGNSRVAGNLGQPNQSAHYLVWGIVSSLYLAARGKISIILGFAVASALLFAAILTASRIVPIFLVASPLALLLGRPRTREAKLLLRMVVALFLPLVVFNAAIPAMREGVPAPLNRLAPPSSEVTGRAVAAGVAEDVAESTRIKGMHTALTIAAQYPMLGGGAGSYSWLGFQLAGITSTETAERAHNLPMDIAAEFGFPLALLVSALLAWQLWALARGSHDLPVAWAALIATMTAIHSLVEYPLWYAYFLGVIAVILGAATPLVLPIALGRRSALYIAAIGGAGLVALSIVGKDYATLMRIANNPMPPIDSLRGREAREDLVRLATSSMLAPWATMYLAMQTVPSREQAANQSLFCQRTMRNGAPRATFGVKCAVLLAIEGKHQEAIELTRQLATTYPGEVATMDSIVAGYEEEFPELTALRPVLIPLGKRPGWRGPSDENQLLRKFRQSTAP
jgi:hypothetical protein